MKHYFSFNRSFILILALCSFTEFVSAQFVYLNPLPGSKYRNPQTTLAIKNGSFMDASSVAKKDWIEITGSKSGPHTWTARLSDDRKTIIVKPQPVFDYSETVSVTIHSKLKKEDGQKINGKTFSFQIRDEITPEQKEKIEEAHRRLFSEEFENNPSRQSNVRDQDLNALPTYVVTINNNAAQ